MSTYTAVSLCAPLTTWLGMYISTYTAYGSDNMATHGELCAARYCTYMKTKNRELFAPAHATRKTIPR